MKLHELFQEMLDKGENDSNMTMFDLVEIFMRVSGDIQAVREHLKGNRVAEWSYLDDMALAMAENSTEYRCLL